MAISLWSFTGHSPKFRIVLDSLILGHSPYALRFSYNGSSFFTTDTSPKPSSISCLMVPNENTQVYWYGFFSVSLGFISSSCDMA